MVAMCGLTSLTTLRARSAGQTHAGIGQEDPNGARRGCRPTRPDQPRLAQVVPTDAMPPLLVIDVDPHGTGSPAQGLDMTDQRPS